MYRPTRFCLFLLVLGLTGCSRQGDHGPDGPAPRAVEVVELREESLAEPLSLIGEIEPWQEAVLSFEVPGVVAEVFVEEGHMLEPGAPIARLALEDYELAVSQAEAQQKAAAARLKLLQVGTRKEDLDAAQADYARAASRAKYWANELTRATALFHKNTIAASQLEVIQREYSAADQDTRLTKARWERAVAGPRTEEIETAMAEFEARMRATDLARNQRQKAVLRAPFRGRVEQRFLDVGAAVQVLPTGAVPVVRLVDLTQVDAVVAVPEAAIPRLVDKPRIEIAAAVDPRIRAAGEIAALGQIADHGTRTYKLRVRIPNPDGRFTGGMVVTAKTLDEHARSAIRVPLAALCQAYGRPPYVLVVERGQDRVVAREVELGPFRGEYVEIPRGLSAGELLIVRGQDRVIAGERVTCRQASPVSLAGTQRSRP